MRSRPLAFSSILLGRSKLSPKSLLHQNSIFSTIHLRHDVSDLSGPGVVLLRRRSTPTTTYFYFPFRATLSPKDLFMVFHLPVRLFPRQSLHTNTLMYGFHLYLSVQHPGDVTDVAADRDNNYDPTIYPSLPRAITLLRHSRMNTQRLAY